MTVSPPSHRAPDEPLDGAPVDDTGHETGAVREMGTGREVQAGPPYEVRRRTWLFTVIIVVAAVLAAAFTWLTIDQGRIEHAAVAGALAVVALTFAVAMRGAGAPLLVADDHGIRLLDRDGWSGYLWSEMAVVEVLPAHGVRHATIHVVGSDGVAHEVPLGLATTHKVARAERELARRRAAAAY